MRTTKTAILFVVLAAICSAAFAAPPVLTLPNGVRLIIRERHDRPLVAIDVWMRAGSREERPGEIACAHFLEHALFKGTKTRPAGQVDLEMESLGGTINAATSTDAAHYYTVVPTAAFSGATALMADVIRNATLDQTEIDRERNVILSELALRRATPDERIMEAAYSKVMRGQPYERRPAGTATAVNACTRSSLLHFYRRNYRPDRATLVIVGDVTPTQGLAAVYSAFGDWSAASELDAADLPQTIVQSTAPLPVGGATIALAFRSPPASSYNDVATERIVAELVQGHGGTSRIDFDYVPSTSFTVHFSVRKDPCLFFMIARLSGSSTGDSVRRVATVMYNAFLSLIDNPPSSSEIEAATRRLRADRLITSETCAGLARAIGSADSIGGENPVDADARLTRIGAADIRAFLGRYAMLRQVLLVNADYKVETVK